MPSEISAKEIIERMRQNLGVPWKEPSADIFYAGKPETVITGVATTWTPSLDVLRRAIASKKNMIISRESPYWLHEASTPEFSGAGAPFSRAQMAADPIYQFKQDFIAKNNLVVFRFVDNWNGRKLDGQLHALMTALSWDKYRKGDIDSSRHAYFELPVGSLQQLTVTIRRQINVRTMRVLGDPQSSVRRIALTHGFLLVPELEEVLAGLDVDVVVTGEPVEWEAFPYCEDWISAGNGKAMIILGSEVSEEPGSGAVAAWMRSFITEVPVEWLANEEPFWPANSTPADALHGGAL